MPDDLNWVIECHWQYTKKIAELFYKEAFKHGHKHGFDDGYKAKECEIKCLDGFKKRTSQNTR